MDDKIRDKNNARLWYLRKCVLEMIQKDFAEKIGRSVRYINKIENADGGRIPPALIVRITKAFPDINPEWLSYKSDRIKMTNPVIETEPVSRIGDDGNVYVGKHEYIPEHIMKRLRGTDSETEKDNISPTGRYRVVPEGVERVYPIGDLSAHDEAFRPLIEAEAYIKQLNDEKDRATQSSE
jgi:transcriptional regulator with XRE-family HTH domain